MKLTIDVFEGDETAYLLRSPANREHLLKAIADIEQNRNLVVLDPEPDSLPGISMNPHDNL